MKVITPCTVPHSHTPTPSALLFGQSKMSIWHSLQKIFSHRMSLNGSCLSKNSPCLLRKVTVQQCFHLWTVKMTDFLWDPPWFVNKSCCFLSHFLKILINNINSNIFIYKYLFQKLREGFKKMNLDEQHVILCWDGHFAHETEVKKLLMQHNITSILFLTYDAALLFFVGLVFCAFKCCHHNVDSLMQFF